MEGGIARCYGICMTMGTASTMTAITEAIGMSLPGASVDPGRRLQPYRACASNAGRRIVDMVWEDLTPANILTPPAFDNGIAVAMAMGARPTPSSM